ncbi:MAG: ABC transporter permease subunit [Candidatus Latescibacterota bacterium]|nr:MAG: ABC transporter permease subunit [Candidatus Latescibacterota bacterium]
MRTLVSSSKLSVPAITIAKYTIKGYIKERVLLVVLVFAFLLMISSYVLAPLAVGAQKKIIIDVGLASVSVFGVLLVVLMGAGSYSREKDKGILPGILAKPISRVDFVLGKFLGTWMTVTVVMACMTAVYFAVMLLSRTALSKTIFVALHLSVLEVALITATLSFFSSFTSPLLSSLFTLCVFISGHLSTDLLAFAKHFGGVGFKIAASIGYYLLPNLSLFNIRSEAVHGLPLMDNYISSVTIYGVFYTLLLLFLSALIFRRKDVT